MKTQSSNIGYSKISYLMLAIIVIALIFTFFNLTNNPDYRQIGYLSVIGIANIGLLIVSLGLTFGLRGKVSVNTITVYTLLILFQAIMLYFVPMGIGSERLSYYFSLSLIATIGILFSIFGNVLGHEKKEGQGFSLYIHDEDSVLNKMPIIGKGGVILAWIGIFFLMFALIATTGSAFLSYPNFGLVDNLANPILASFGVGDWENIAFIFLPAEFGMFIIALLIGSSVESSITVMLHAKSLHTSV